MHKKIRLHQRKKFDFGHMVRYEITTFGEVPNKCS